MQHATRRTQQRPCPVRSLPAPRPTPRSAGAALVVVATVAAVRGLVYTAASTPAMQHTTATAFTLTALAIASVVTLGACPRAAPDVRWAL